MSTSELRFGDNDTLSAITAGLVDADYLFLCTDVDGLYTGNPRSNPNARRLGVVRSVQEARRAVSVDTPGTNFGTGGMQTKLIAAELATAAGVATVIVSSERPADVIDIVRLAMPVPADPSPSASAGQDSMASSIASLTEEQASLVGYPPLTSPNHTMFLPTPTPLPSRKWSILHALHPSGSIVIDEGAYRRISKPESGGRLLPAGVVEVKGNWERMQAVRLVVRKSTQAEASGANPSTEPMQRPQRLAHLPAAVAGVVAGSNDLSRPSSPGTPPVIDGLAHRSQTAQTVQESASANLSVTPASAAVPASGASNTDHANFRDTDAWEYHEVGRCLANYTSLEVERIKGLKSREIQRVLGHADSDYVTDQVALVERVDD